MTISLKLHHKYNYLGQQIWNISHDGGDYDSAYGITVDSLGNVYVTGVSNYLVDDGYFTIDAMSAGQTTDYFLTVNMPYSAGSEYENHRFQNPKPPRQRPLQLH